MFALIRNMPGYLPESEPEIFEEIEDAWLSVREFVEEQWQDWVEATNPDLTEQPPRAYAEAWELLNRQDFAEPGTLVFAELNLAFTVQEAWFCSANVGRDHSTGCEEVVLFEGQLCDHHQRVLDYLESLINTNPWEE